MDLVERLRELDKKGYQPLTGAIGEEAATEIERLRSLLRRGLGQLGAWQEKYGDWQPQWLPPAGDVRWAEDVSEALPPNATGQARPQGVACTDGLAVNE